MKKVFLNDLPKITQGRNKGGIDWNKCIGLIINFYYEDIMGWVQITSYSNENKEQLLTLKYKNIDGFKIRTPHFIQSKLGFLVNNIVVNENTKWMISYFQEGYDEAKLYTYNSNKKIYPICPKCGKFKKQLVSINNIYNKKSIRCSCSDGISYPNKFAYKMLKELSVNFQAEYSPKWLGQKRYDFYFELNNKKYILEMDGYFHNNDNKMNNVTSKKSKSIDDYKDEQARLHGIEVIRIDCDYDNMGTRFKYIKQNIFNSRLNELFDLSIVNWNKCNEFSLISLIEVVSNMKSENDNLTTTQIANLMGGYDKNTIRNWLIEGSRNGWCRYDANEEKKKNCSKNGKSLGKQVEIFKDTISLGIFPSCAELGRKSEELFGVKLDFGGVSAVCMGKKSQYKGFIFKYI